MIFTKDKLFQIFPNSRKSKLDIDLLVDVLNDVFDNPNGLSTLNRRASFLAQCAHESGQFTVVSENLNYSAAGLLRVFKKYFPTQELADQYARKPQMIASRVYANRMENGSEASGDGWKFRGRGFIQLTGKRNYRLCGAALGINLLEDPDYVSRSPVGAIESALWFWTVNNLNSYADRDDLKGQTKVINGGYNGLEERLKYYAEAKRVLAGA
jgi:putative chitinase